MPLVQTRGAASAQGFGEFAVVTAVNYIEDVFSTYLYTGNGSTQTITNGIDLSTKGGLVWTKVRNFAFDHSLYDSARGFQNILSSNTVAASSNASPFGLTALTTGFTDATGWSSAYNVATWTFRKQPKFFDIITYTGTGTNNLVPHNLGSAPGCVIGKATGVSGDWGVWHRGNGLANASILGISLNKTNPAASTTGSQAYSTSTTFDVSVIYDYTGGTPLNVLGRQYVAYLFAHDAGGFGLTGTDNVISCGSYTGNGSAIGPTITLGYEPQWIMIKKSSAISGSESWAIWDNMRNSGLWDDWLIANDSQAEQVNNANVAVQITSTGFFPNATNNTANSYVNTSGSTYIYIAIRRGPMKVPTVGTSVFNLQNSTEPVSTPIFSAGTAPPDVILNFPRYNGVAGPFWLDRLRGNAISLTSATAAAETSPAAVIPPWFFNTGQQATIAAGAYYNNGGGSPLVQYSFIRASSFFDEVCYTGTGSATTVAHNLTVAPELMIVKKRSASDNWQVYHQSTAAGMGPSKFIVLNSTAAESSGSDRWNSTAPTSSVFTVGNAPETNSSGATFVAYLFATCAGVSKVGSYTGNAGYTVTVPCGFTGGVRFVLIKRTDSTGDWYVWDSARGIVAGNDPYLLLNSTAAEVTGTDYIDTYSAGFEVTSTAPAGLNATGGTYIFLAIA